MSLFCLFYRQLTTLETEFCFFLDGFFGGGQGEVLINNIVCLVTACSHVCTYLRHLDVFVPNAMNHPFSCLKLLSEVS